MFHACKQVSMRMATEKCKISRPQEAPFTCWKPVLMHGTTTMCKTCVYSGTTSTWQYLHCKLPQPSTSCALAKTLHTHTVHAYDTHSGCFMGRRITCFPENVTSASAAGCGVVTTVARQLTPQRAATTHCHTAMPTLWHIHNDSWNLKQYNATTLVCRTRPPEDTLLHKFCTCCTHCDN